MTGASLTFWALVLPLQILATLADLPPLRELPVGESNKGSVLVSLASVTSQHSLRLKTTQDDYFILDLKNSYQKQRKILCNDLKMIKPPKDSDLACNKTRELQHIHN